MASEDLTRYSVAELEPIYWSLMAAGDPVAAEPYRAELASRTWQWHNPYEGGNGTMRAPLRRK